MNPSLSWDSAKTKVGRSHFPYFTLNYIERQRLGNSCSCFSVLACLPSSASSPSSLGFNFKKTKLYVSGLSFRTTEESLQNAFQNFGQLVDVNLLMDKVAKRPRGFAFLRYKTEEEAQKAIEGMHGKFLDGRVIFVEVAKPRSELRQSQNYGQR
ncbi:NUCLEOLAR PROTEIN 8 [Salix koriyanagi]|uniref:NUCLEOLAR PROTEIN 8 n=1 Tax=Salix koriyanagi TaxID=2511006 RepID=A0A9Q0WDW2_9ROSI|nr:NUCLEOLAR PROTEIN 8 [Salix koriyanagi]